MGYCTLDDLYEYGDKKTIVKLSDDDLDDVPDANVIAEIIDGASSDIDVYLSRYQLPFAIVPKILVKFCAKISIYYLYLRRKEARMPTKIEGEYNNIIDVLQRISAGEITLGADAEGNRIKADIKFARDKSEITFNREAFEKMGF